MGPWWDPFGEIGLTKKRTPENHSDFRGNKILWWTRQESNL